MKLSCGSTGGTPEKQSMMVCWKIVFPATESNDDWMKLYPRCSVVRRDVFFPAIEIGSVQFLNFAGELNILQGFCLVPFLLSAKQAVILWISQLWVWFEKNNPKAQLFVFCLLHVQKYQYLLFLRSSSMVVNSYHYFRSLWIERFYVLNFKFLPHINF